MKLVCIILALCVLVVSGEEHPRGKVVQLCGAELAKAVKRVCEDGDLAFFNSQQVPHHQHEAHHHNHQHDPQDNKKGYAMKREAPPSLADMCCSKPCHIDDLVSYCP